MDVLYSILRFVHVIGFVFMAIPLFNLIVVNERGLMGSAFDYSADRYMENIIRRGAMRCYVFQTTVLVSGVLILVTGPLSLSALWGNWAVLAKLLILFTLMGLLSYVHFGLQPRIEGIMAEVGPDAPPPEDILARLKPPRSLRKRLATVCLFLVITTIIFGLQVYGAFPVSVTLGLIAAGGLFAWRANRTLVRFGWM